MKTQFRGNNQNEAASNDCKSFLVNNVEEKVASQLLSELKREVFSDKSQFLPHNNVLVEYGNVEVVQKDRLVMKCFLQVLLKFNLSA